MSGIYIHVPFCYQRCHYCDFYSTLRLEDRNSFVKALIREIISRKDFLKGEIIDTLYFGGGTPSVLDSKSIDLIIKKIRSNYSLNEDVEITLEANPDDLNKKYLNELINNGVNRLSIGIQSFIDKDLEKLNRRHNTKQAMDAVLFAHEIGFKKISIDLIYGLPGQKIEDWEKNLEKAVSLPVEHISAYHLTYEKGTRFYKWLKECKMSEADENLSLDFFHATIKILEREGFDHYEISNFARNNQYSRHNIKYWLGEQYLGIGPSAHSYNGIVRQWNIADFDRWMKNDQENSEVLKSEKIDREIRRNEMIMTRLRTKWGIPQAEFIELFGYEAWEKLLELITPFLIGNFVEYKNNKIVLTQKGKFLADGIIADLFILAKA